MSTGQLIANHWESGMPVAITWSNGRITELEECTPDEKPCRWIAPGLFDIQINGYAGVDFQQEIVSGEALIHAVERLQADGCARFLLTLITSPWDSLLERIRHLRKLRQSSPILEASIAGWHLEGPFLSPEAGYRGAHNTEWMCDPKPRLMEELSDVVEDDLVLLTLAPERAGAMEAIRHAKARGWKVSLGHTNAPAECMREAVQAGASGFTHLGNACPQLLDRHDNIVWRVLDTRGLTISLIPDRIHVSPSLFRLVHRLPEQPIIYTTDAMSAAGAGPGRYRLGGLELEVGADQVVRQPGQTNFAGSALPPSDGIRYACAMLGARWEQVWPAFSTGPATFLGLSAGLAAGSEATFCVITPVAGVQQFELQMIYRGRPVEER